MASAQTNEQSVMLLESGSLTAHNLGDVEGSTGAGSGAEVRRGMSVQTGEGRTAGRVAAVMLDQTQQKVTHILLMRERQRLEYRLVPVELIKQVSDEKVLLRIFQPVVENLPIWHGV
jgi:sporulation protein YlmC with PRC-barrel domain